MQFSTSCPACGATVSLTNDTDHVSCPFCGRDFDVDLSQASPELRPGAGKPKEYIPSLEPEIPEPVIPDEVIPAAQPPAPMPALEGKESPYARFEPPADTVAKVKKTTNSLGKWLWVLIILLVLMCVSCVALTAVAVNWFTQL